MLNNNAIIHVLKYNLSPNMQQKMKAISEIYTSALKVWPLLQYSIYIFTATLEFIYRAELFSVSTKVSFQFSVFKVECYWKPIYFHILRGLKQKSR